MGCNGKFWFDNFAAVSLSVAGTLFCVFPSTPSGRIVSRQVRVGSLRGPCVNANVS